MSKDPLLDAFGTTLPPDRAERLREKLARLKRVTLVPTPTSDPQEEARSDVIYGATTMEEVAKAVLRKRSSRKDADGGLAPASESGKSPYPRPA